MKGKHGVHINHCCNKHGCKYGDKDCPVVRGIAKQNHICELCEDETKERKMNSVKGKCAKCQKPMQYDHGKYALTGEIEFFPCDHIPDIKEPKKLENIDWTEVINLAESIKDEVINLGEDYIDDSDSDNGEYMYQEVMKAVYGEDYFKWVNNRNKIK